jgi:NIMA (never in mitosis gene a)-related kinase
LYELCTLKHPFEAQNQGALVLKIMKGVYPPISTSYSPELSKVIQMCLNKDANIRPTTNQLLSTKAIMDKVYFIEVQNIS